MDAVTGVTAVDPVSSNTSMAKLTYFRGRGRAETTRWMLAVTETEFVQEGLTSPQEFAALK